MGAAQSDLKSCSADTTHCPKVFRIGNPESEDFKCCRRELETFVKNVRESIQKVKSYRLGRQAFAVRSVRDTSGGKSGPSIDEIIEQGSWTVSVLYEPIDNEKRHDEETTPNDLANQTAVFYDEKSNEVKMPHFEQHVIDNGVVMILTLHQDRHYFSS